jgi:competence protein ComEC
MRIPNNETEPQQNISRSGWFIFGILLVSSVLSFIAVGTSAQSDGLLKVYFLNVGQGDSEFIQAPNGNHILIDGGPDGKVLQELGKVMPFYDHSIDLVILSHPHADHLDGLIEVMKNYKVSKIIENNINFQNSDYDEWNKIKNGAEVVQAKAGQVVDLGDGITLNILYPCNTGSAGVVITGSMSSKVHNYMVVSRLNYGTESVMFTGDMETKVEDELINKGVELGARFLKVGHHGSTTSTSEEFLDAVKPEVAFIEVGAKNIYRLPNPTIVQRLENHGIKYYRTDISGTVELSLDGQNYKINN